MHHTCRIRPWLCSIILIAWLPVQSMGDGENVARKPLFRDPVHEHVSHRRSGNLYQLERHPGHRPPHQHQPAGLDLSFHPPSCILLEQPGIGTDDQVKGGHADVVVNGARAFLFYFTHPGRRGAHADGTDYEQRRSSIQVAELELKDGWLACDRDHPTHIRLAN